MKTRAFTIVDAMLYGLLFFLIIVTLYPFLYITVVSLSGGIFVLKGNVFFWPKGFTLENYKYVLSDPRIGIGYWNTIVNMVIGTSISLVCTAAGAYAISKKELPFRGFFIGMIIFTMFFGGGLIPTYLVVNWLGLMNTRWSLLLPEAITVWYLMVMRSFFLGIPRELEESGKVDGLTDVGLFTKIVLPLSKPVLAAIGLFYAVRIWKDFFSAIIYIRDPGLYPLQLVLRNIVIAGQLNSGDAMSVGGDNMLVGESLKYATILVSTVPILLIYPFIQRHFEKGMLIGSIKG